MPAEPSGKPSEHQARLFELLDEFKRARDQLHQAQEDEKRFSDLGAKLAEPARQAELQSQARAAKPEDLERLGFGVVLNNLVHGTIEQQEIERIRTRRKKAESDLRQVWETLRRPLDQFRAVETRDAFAPLDEMDRCLPYHTSIEAADRRIGLVEKIIRDAGGPHKKVRRRAGRDLNDDSRKIDAIKVLIRKINDELAQKGSPKKGRHEAICRRLHDHDRPPGAKWARPMWDRAYADPKYTKSVRAWISKALRPDNR
jgi:hypothetical protein